MHSFSRSTILFLIAASGMALPAFAQDKKKEPKKPVAPASKPAKPAAKAPERKKGLDGLSDLPIPKGSPQKEIRFPVYSPDGKKTMYYRIGVAKWADDENIEMREMELQTFDAEGKQEYTVKLPDAVLNVPTNVITAKARVTIRDERMEVIANSLSYNMAAKTEDGKPDRVATLGGGVKMTIYDIDSVTGPRKKADGPQIEIEPIKDEPTTK